MHYDPNMALELGFNSDETLAYQLVCAWEKLTKDLLPSYGHPKIARKGDLRKTLIFKHMIKFVKEKKTEFKGFQYILFMRAQLEIAKKLINEGKRILIDASILHGEKAQARYIVWKKLVKQKRKDQKAVYAYVETSVINEFNKTLKTLNDILKNDFSLDRFKQESSNILKYIILKKISPLYVICSKWTKELPEPIRTDIYDLANIDNLRDFDLTEIQKQFIKFFPHES